MVQDINDNNNNNNNDDANNDAKYSWEVFKQLYFCEVLYRHIIIINETELMNEKYLLYACESGATHCNK